MGDIVLYEGNNVLNVNLTPLAPPVANLYGIVTDADTGLPIGTVKVSINGWTVYTNGNGEYSFEGLTPGGYELKFEKEGYQTVVR